MSFGLAAAFGVYTADGCAQLSLDRQTVRLLAS